jgi:hypothetical protein
MALPKKRKLNIGIKNTTSNGKADWVNQFMGQNKQFLPRDVDINDLDGGFYEFIKTDLRDTLGFGGMPAHFLTLQRWAEFKSTWQDSDKYKNMEIPFMTVTKVGSPEVGSNPADFKIPVREKFPYMKVPIMDSGTKNVDIYSIPNPVGVDLSYEVRFFSYKMSEINSVYQIISEIFASAQAYVNIKGHYFPILLDEVVDESEVTNLDSKRFYVQKYVMRLQGYIVDSEEFEVKPAISRIFLMTELSTKKLKPTVNKFYDKQNDETLDITLIIQFLPKAETELYFTSDDSVQVTSISLDNVDSYIMKVNGIVVNTPFTIRENDTIYLNLDKTDGLESSEIALNGIVI